MKNSEAKLISKVSNIFYLTGFSGFYENEREAFVILTNNKKYIITDRRYSEAIKNQTKGFEIIDIGAINFIGNEAKEFFEKENIDTLLIEDDNLTVAEFKILKKYIRMRSLDSSRLRIIKNSAEIENIKKACEIGDEAFKFIQAKLKVGITEENISDQLILFFKQKNADKSFDPIVAFGNHSSIPHHQSGNTKLLKNQIVLLDFGVKINNYCSDMTRTVFFGKADKKFKRIYETVLNAQKKAIEELSISKKASEIDSIARDYIISQGYPNIIHAVGHGIGIDVHEAPILSPKSKDILENNMVFSIEPGIYIPGYGGVRIEDLVLVRDNRAELISHSKREIIELND